MKQKTKRQNRSRPLRPAPAPEITRPRLRETLAQLQQVVGGDNQIRVEQPDWVNLMKSGVIIRLHIRRWRAKTQVTLQDLGLPEPKNDAEKAIYAELMDLGTKRLLPSTLIRELEAIDSGARKFLAGCSYKTYWGDFVTIGAYADWKAGTEPFRIRYLQLRDQIARDWKVIISELLNSYALAARNAYARLSRLNPKALQDDKGRRIDSETFVVGFLSRIETAIPTREKVIASFAFETDISFIPLPSLLAEGLAEKERIENQRNVDRLALSDYETRQKQMFDDLISKAKREKEQLISEFISDLELGQYELLGGFDNALDSIGRNDDKLVGKAAEQIRNVSKTWRARNLIAQPAIAALIQELDVEMDKKLDQRASVNVKRILVEIVRTVKRESAKTTYIRQARPIPNGDELSPSQDLGRQAQRGI